MRGWHVRRRNGVWTAWEDGRDPERDGYEARSWWAAWAYALLNADPGAAVWS